MAKTPTPVVDVGEDYKYGFHDPEAYAFKGQRGLNTAE